MQQHQQIQRPHSTTPTPSRKLHLHLHHHHHHHLYHRYQQQQQQQQQPCHQHQHSWSSPLLDTNHPLLPQLITPATPKSSSSSRSSPLQPRHRTPPSPLLSPIPYSKLAANGLTRANSLPGQIPRSSLNNTLRPSPNSRSRFSKPTLPNSLHHGSPPPLTRLPTSPTPASAVTGESGLTVSGRMVEYESDHSRSEALSRALRAVSQSGIGRSRHRSRQNSPAAIKHRSLSYTAASSSSPNAETYTQTCSPYNENMTPMNREERFGEVLRPRPIGRTTTLTPPTPTTEELRDEAMGERRIEGAEGGFPFGYTEGWCGGGGGNVNGRLMDAPNSQASGYISFSSLNLFAPPSPPHSLNEFNHSTLLGCPPNSADTPPSASLDIPIRRPFTP